MNADVPSVGRVMASTTFTSKYPNVVFEESDSEVVIVDLMSGVYYFVTGMAAFIWVGVQSGMSAGEVEETLSVVAPDGVEVPAEVQNFLNELTELDLLVVANADVKREHPRPNLNDFLGNGYVSPTIESHADLQDILLLDPVHDVDGSGWPQAKQ